MASPPLQCAAPSSPISCPSSRDTCCPAPPQIRTVRNTSQISLAIRTPAVISNKNKELVTDLCDGSGHMTTENRLSLKARCQLAHLLDRILVRHGHPGQNSLGPLELRIQRLQLPSANSVSPPCFQCFREHLLYLVRATIERFCFKPVGFLCVLRLDIDLAVLDLFLLDR